MSQGNLNLLALDFLKSLPPETARQWPVPAALCNVYIHLNEWRKIEDVTKNAQWGSI